MFTENPSSNATETMPVLRSYTPTAVKEISDMLTFCRPAGSKAEKQFISKFIRPLGVEQDGRGNLRKRIGTAPVLWSCHTDTVHHFPGYQTVIIDPKGTARLTATGSLLSSNCLGADDTAGVWLMMEMIRVKVEGLYIFHRAEECGGIGSMYIASNHADMLKEYKFAIALDRKGKSDIITHQGWSNRCCSDKFANSLSKQLGGSFEPSDKGIFTDTANYVDHIGECTNISVGYENQHLSTENLDTNFLQKLRDQLCQIDISQLDSERKPGEVDDDKWWKDDKYDSAFHYGYSRNTVRNYKKETTSTSQIEDTVDHITRNIHGGGRTYGDGLQNLVERYPDVVADMLESFGVDEDFLQRYIEERGY